MSSALTPPQARALAALAPLLGDAYYVAGGVAVASHLHHRVSKDIDLFTRDADPEALAASVSALPGARVTARSAGTLQVEFGGVPVSLLRYAYPMLEEPQLRDALPVRVASADDLVCMKLSAIAGRCARRDFWDLYALLQASGASLDAALARFREKYAHEDIGHVVRSLAYFADAEAEPMPAGMTSELWSRIRTWFEEHVRRIG